MNSKCQASVIIIVVIIVTVAMEFHQPNGFPPFGVEDGMTRLICDCWGANPCENDAAASRTSHCCPLEAKYKVFWISPIPSFYGTKTAS